MKRTAVFPRDAIVAIAIMMAPGATSQEWVSTTITAGRTSAESQVILKAYQDAATFHTNHPLAFAQ